MGLLASPSPPWTQRRLCSGAGPRDPRSVLGVGPEATPAQIREAFLQKCKQVHPDGDPSDPSRHGRFLLLAEAYRVLSTQGTPPPPAAPPPPPNHPPPRRRRGGLPRWYWDQFPPRGAPPPASQRRRLLGLCLLLVALGGVAHALAYRYVAGAHSAFLDQRDRVLRNHYERIRSRAGSRQEVLQRLRASRQRGRGGGGAGGGEGQ